MFWSQKDLSSKPNFPIYWLCDLDKLRTSLSLCHTHLQKRNKIIFFCWLLGDVEVLHVKNLVFKRCPVSCSDGHRHSHMLIKAMALVGKEVTHSYIESPGLGFCILLHSLLSNPNLINSPAGIEPFPVY